MFQYWMVEPDKLGISGIKMTFYGGADVFIAFQPKDVNFENDTTRMLIENGVKVLTNFPDEAPPVEFN